MRARALSSIAAGVWVLAGGASALAQDATPAAESPFASLGLPELTVTATDAGFEISESEIPAGRYVVNLVNESNNPEVAAGFVRLVEGKTLDDLSFADELASGAPIPEEMPGPEAYPWLYDTYIAGGVSAMNDEAVLDLPGGEYGVWADDPTSALAAAPLTVTGDPNSRIEGPTPEAAMTLVEEGAGGEGFKFTVSGDWTSGPQVVQILNASDQPHLVIGFQYPEEITLDQAMAFIMFDPASGAIPPPGMLDETRLTFPIYAPTQSIGTTQWVVMDLSPGQVMLVCFVPDPKAEGLPHAFEGMISLEPVAER